MYHSDLHILKLKKTFVACLLCIFSLLFPLKVKAEDMEQKTVHVGYYVNECFQEGTSDSDVKRGYGYEYLRKVACYTGWKYEYVYGTWADLYEMFIDGDIDIMAGISKMEGREDVLFPDQEMGIEGYYLYRHEDDTDIVDGEPLTVSGKRIGVIHNTTMEYSLIEWLKECDIEAEIVAYDGFEEERNAFEQRQIDAFVEMDFNITTDSGCAPVIKIGQMAYYLAVTKQRTDLLEDLNNALTILNEVEPYFRQNLQYTNYRNSLIGHTLSEPEQAWVNTHSVMHVGYFENYLPYCGSDQNGNASGLVRDVLSEITQRLQISDQIEIVYSSYQSYEQMVSDLQSGTLDAAFPVSGELWHGEQDGIFSSSPVVSAGVDLAFAGGYDEKTLASIAVNRNNRMQYYYTVSNFPDSRIVFYSTTADCLDAVAHGQAGSTILNGIRTNSLLSDSKYSSLMAVQLPQTDDFCFGVADGNDQLLLLLNRGIRLIGEDYGINASHKYMTYSYTAVDFVRENAVPIVIIIVIIAGIIIFLLVREARNRRLYTKEIENSKNELALAFEAAESASNAKSAFLFNLSHDIRTPMNAIMGFTGLLKTGVDDPQVVRDYVGKIETASGFLLSLINNVLEMARIESGKAVLDESANDVYVFWDGLQAMFDNQMKEKDLSYEFEIHVEHPYVMVDVTKMREILLNIVSNAVKYTPEHGTVSVIVKELPSQKEGYVLYQTVVKDSGIGMSAEFLPHVFEEFTREKTGTEHKVEGTGLGMPIVKKLVDLMNGTITVESEQGKGSTFTVTTAHRIAERSEIVIPDEPVAEHSLEDYTGKRILLAEDNDLNAEIAMTILEMEGFVVDRAEDGAQCVEMLVQAQPEYYDLILMDIQMPNMDGYGATRAIRRMEDQVKSDIPIIAMTANAFEEDRKKAFRMGMNGHIIKPIQIESMKAILGHVLSRKEQDRESYESWHAYFDEYDAFRTFREQYRIHGKACGCLVYEAKGDGRIVFADENLIRIFGCDSYSDFQQYTGGTFKTIVHPDDSIRVETEIRKQIQESEDSLERVRYHIVRKDGVIREVDDIGRKVFTENGSSVFYVCIVDITD